MAAALTATLVELRKSVLARCGISSAGDQASNPMPMLDEHIRSAQRELLGAMEWAHLRKNAAQALVTGEAQYDLADDLGDIGEILFVNIIDVNGRRRTLAPGFYPEEKADDDTENGEPTHWNFEEQVLLLNIPPDATEWPTLEVSYTVGDAPLNQDTDRCLIDSELLIQRATILLKEDMAPGSTQAMNARFALYFNIVRAKNSTGSGMNLSQTELRRRAGGRGNPGGGVYDNRGVWRPW